MSKKFFGILVAVIFIITNLFSGMVLAAETPLTVQNGNFEQSLKSWRYNQADGISFEVMEDSTKYVKIVDESESAAALLTSAAIAVPDGKAGEIFTLSYRSKTPSGKSPATIGVRLYDANDTQLHTGTKSLGNLSTTEDFSPKTAQFVPSVDVKLTEGKSTADIKSIRIILYTTSTVKGFESYIDDIVLTYGAEKAVSTASTEVITIPNNDPEGGYKSEALNALKVSDPVCLGTPITDVQVLGSYTHVRENGENVVYAGTSGPPATFFVYNVDKNLIETKHFLQSVDGSAKAKVVYSVVMDSQGIINIVTQSDCMYFRYDPKTDTVRSYGKVFEETAVMAPGYVDENDNFYFGTYPNAKLVKYDKATDSLVDLGTFITESNYVRSMAGYGNKIYGGGMGNPTTKFVKYDISTKTKTTLKNPELPGVFTQADVENFYTMNTAGKYLFAKCKISNIQKYYLAVFDMEKDEWVDYIEGTFHLHTTQLDGDVVYIHKYNNELKKNLLHSYNVKTKELTPFPNLEYGDYIVSPGIVYLKDQVKYPGKTIVGGAGTKGLILLNLEKQEITLIKDILPAQATQIRTLKAGYNNEIVISAYMGSKFVSYDSINEKNKYEGSSVQIEGINVFNGNYYFGLYGKSRLTRYNPNEKPSSSNPLLLSDMGKEEQDRGFVVEPGKGNDIVWGSVPDYGRLGGAVGIYNPDTKEKRAYRNVVENQAIGGLAYKDGKLYGSTHVFGGLGIDPIDDNAKLFVMDYETGKVENKVDIKLSTDKDKQYFAGGMTFGPDGNLYVATQKTLLCVNPANLEIIKEIPIGSQKITIKNARYLPYSMEWDKDNLLITNIGYRISAVDISTGEVKQLLGRGTNGLTIGENGNIYFIDNDITRLAKIKVSKGNDLGLLDSAITLFINSNVAYVNGEKKMLDSQSENVKATIIEDRTLVPVRFIAESFGAKVDWNGETSTATITTSDKVTNITLNKKEIVINGETISLDVPAMVIDDRTMLPLRVFCEKVMGKNVFWDARGLIVISNENILDPAKDSAKIDSLVSMFK